MNRSRLLGRWRVVATGLGGVLAGVALWLAWPSSPAAVPASAVASDPATVERGRYLATLGNCQHCHTPQGAMPYAGGRALATPFGTVFAPNLTPSAQGLGGWDAGDFWRALHHGQSRDGRWLTPAFPFANTTHVTRADSDALFAYLQSLPPVDTPSPPHQLAWPYNTQAALKVWRALYFSPAEAQPAPAPAQAEWARGAYLVQGLGHCGACHAERNALGASPAMAALGGGLVPGQGWYAPSLTDPAEGGLQDWPLAQIVELFRTGQAGGQFTTGPMAAVVQHSTQRWTDSDLQAMATYLQQLPRTAAGAARTGAAPSARQAELGAKVYGQHCAQCHGEQGEGTRLPNGRFAYPPLAGSRAVTLGPTANLVQTVLHGGFSVSSPGQPRPFGMPPYVLALSDTELAAVLTHLRTQWGNTAAPVTELDVKALR